MRRSKIGRLVSGPAAFVGIAAGMMTPTAAGAAGYSVNARSYSRAGHAGGTSCYYNYGGATGCSGLDQPGTGGTVTPAGLDATSAATSSMQTGYDYGQTLPETTSMTAAADLSTGSLHFTSSNSDGAPASSYGSGGSASIADTLHFAVAGASSATVTPITVTFTIDGTFKAGGGDSLGEFYGTMVFGSSDAQYYFVNDAASGFATTGTFSTYPSAYPGIWTYNSDYTEASYTESYNLVGDATDIAFSLNGSFNCYTGAICDFGNTAKVGLVLPTGTTYTSDSGVFLSASGAVPETATWALMLCGFGLVGGALRRRGDMLPQL
ncbi:PEPxxWA-CTERM sorting domain-containing protein [Sphingomonas nostoxanthinifaciens]|uniref:PEPxxWA-CTERM sorting domain-containing protein n=1 Tax=Sphingomonas nostoxanthinifaciens TaxID=2872652 RepID=UPI001CC20B6B|nr:PEPxxWA-CTERM sorting domain-containing protein [Sphingomonas nostoxanthinifaciens]UAK24216.1 PEPxxWA-CTERM sorting domain-containing protein [Sphingomonas nostoxanthinifaciens]